MRSLIAAAKGKPNYKAGNTESLFNDAIVEFGKLAEKCLTGDSLEVARLVRNALAHNGGKVSTKLRPGGILSHNLTIDDDGSVQIMAPDTKDLFDNLKERAYSLTELAAAKFK